MKKNKLRFFFPLALFLLVSMQSTTWAWGFRSEAWHFTMGACFSAISGAVQRSQNPLIDLGGHHCRKAVREVLDSQYRTLDLKYLKQRMEGLGCFYDQDIVEFVASLVTETCGGYRFDRNDLKAYLRTHRGLIDPPAPVNLREFHGALGFGCIVQRPRPTWVDGR